MSQLYVPNTQIVRPDLDDSVIDYVSQNPTMDRRQFLRGLGITAIVLAGPVACAALQPKPPSPPIRLIEGMDKTLTYEIEKIENGKKVIQRITVPDLNGLWDLNISEGGKIYFQEAKIEQKENKFIGTKTRGGIIVTNEFLRGTLEPNYSAFRELIKNGPPWEAVKGTISLDLKVIEYSSSMADVILYRK